MRIGELATAAGVTPRAIRHYHHLGLLPEPGRLPNGYRDYTLRHAVLLARVRRLTELGLGLAEVRDVLADDAGRELAEVLGELDEDLARQERALRERRRRVGALLTEARAGRLSANGPSSPELAALLGELDAAEPEAPLSPMAVRDRELLGLLDASADPGDQARLVSLLGETVRAPGAAARAHAVYARLDALDRADPADPRVEETARALADLLPPALADELRTGGLVPDGPDGDGGPEHQRTRGSSTGRDEGARAFMDAVFADFAPAQAAAVRRALALLVDDDR
ncbi:MerR family transcriptional regulator [Streptomyces sp. JNUCC 64]